jgi:hypothetical protein
MRRLLQFGILFFVLVTFLAPLAECFDRWDAPGIGNDTEFAVFFLIFALCLVLLVSKLVSALALLVNLISFPPIRRVMVGWSQQPSGYTRPSSQFSSSSNLIFP